MSPYGQFGDVDDESPIETNIYLTEQLNQFGLAYIHFVEPRIAGAMDCDVRHESYSTQHFRNVWKGTFISAGEIQNRLLSLLLKHALNSIAGAQISIIAGKNHVFKSQVPSLFGVSDFGLSTPLGIWIPRVGCRLLGKLDSQT